MNSHCTVEEHSISYCYQQYKHTSLLLCSARFCFTIWNKFGVSRQIFPKSPKCQIWGKSFHCKRRPSLRTEGPVDRTDLIGAFRVTGLSRFCNNLLRRTSRYLSVTLDTGTVGCSSLVHGAQHSSEAKSCVILCVSWLVTGWNDIMNWATLWLTGFYGKVPRFARMYPDAGMLRNEAYSLPQRFGVITCFGDAVSRTAAKCASGVWIDERLYRI